MKGSIREDMNRDKGMEVIEEKQPKQIHMAQ